LQRIQRDIGERWIEETEHLYRSGGIAAHSESEAGGGFGDTGDVGAAPCGKAAGVFPAAIGAPLSIEEVKWDVASVKGSFLTAIGWRWDAAFSQKEVFLLIRGVCKAKAREEVKWDVAPRKFGRSPLSFSSFLDKTSDGMRLLQKKVSDRASISILSGAQRQFSFVANCK
jgi:hypothetical protein